MLEMSGIASASRVIIVFCLQELGSRDCQTIKIEITDKAEQKRQWFHEYTFSTSRRKFDLTIGSKAEAHHDAWGSTHISEKGAALLE